MLPMPIRSSYSTPNGAVPEYLWRVFNVGQMDFQFAFSQMVDLLRAPAEVYKSTAIRKQIKNQWSRDDPAFVVLLLSLMFFSSLAWLIGFGVHTVSHAVTLLIGALLVQFLGVGAVLSSAIRYYANTAMRVVRLHAIEQQVEWLYAFDIHCNAFFPVFTLLFTLQYFLVPLLLTPAFLSTLLSNSLYLLACFAYLYVTFLGYAALPFIERPERLLYPGTVAVVVFCLSLIANVNVSYWVLNMYFGTRSGWGVSPVMEVVKGLEGSTGMSVQGGLSAEVPILK